MAQYKTSCAVLRDPFGNWDKRERKRHTSDTVIGHAAPTSQRANAALAFTVQLQHHSAGPATRLIAERRLSQRAQRPEHCGKATVSAERMLLKLFAQHAN
jgi:hypothetical protein